MKKFFYGSISIYFGLVAFIVCAWIGFDFFGIQGPDFGPAVGILSLGVGIGAAAIAYPKISTILQSANIPTDVTNTMGGRLAFAINAIYFVSLVWTIFQNNNPIVIIIIPFLVLFLALTFKWIIRGNTSND